MAVDARILLAGRGVEGPDLLGDANRGMVLQNLARAGQLQQMKMDEERRDLQAQEALGGALGNINLMDDNQVRDALGRMPPQVRPLAVKFIQEQRGKMAIEGKDRAEAASKSQEGVAKQFALVGSIAGTLAQQPTREAVMAAKATLQRLRIDPTVLDLPEGVDPMQGYKQLADGAMTRAQQMHVADQGASRAETGRHNQAMEGNTVRGQDMTDARAREMAAAARAQASATRAAGDAQAGALVGKRTTDVELKLADDYRTQSKGWQETAGSIKKINAALKTATTNAGSALAAGTAFMKLLDPGSVVRESELGMALNASGWIDRARNWGAKVQYGGIMTPLQVKNLGEAAKALYDEAAATQQQIDAAYAKRAKDYGADPSRVIIDMGQGGGGKAAGGGLQRAPQGAGVDFVYTPSK